MSEDHTHAPSKRRRQEARAHGLVARSPELTAAVGMLAAVAALALWGGPLTSACVDLIRAPFAAPMTEFDSVVGMLRASIVRVGLPFLGIVGTVALAMIAAHQAQVGGLWSTGLIAPDAARLWSPPGGGGSQRSARGAWGVVKAGVLAAVAAWAIRSDWPMLASLHHRDAGALIAVAALTLRRLVLLLGLAMLALGVIDYMLAHARVETLLRTTPEQSREEAKAVDGDPAVRARRLSLARSWRADPSEILKGAVLIATGPAGLTVVLSGEGPPGRVTVRATARGASGKQIARSARAAGLAVADAPEVARHFASPAARTAPLPASIRLDLATLWPSP